MAGLGWRGNDLDHITEYWTWPDNKRLNRYPDKVRQAIEESVYKVKQKI